MNEQRDHHGGEDAEQTELKEALAFADEEYQAQGRYLEDAENENTRFLAEPRSAPYADMANPKEAAVWAMNLSESDRREIIDAVRARRRAADRGMSHGPSRPRCGTALHDRPETICTEPAGHTGCHVGPLIVSDGREVGRIGWHPEDTACPHGCDVTECPCLECEGRS